MSASAATAIIQYFILPPGLNFLMLLCGYLLIHQWRRLSKVLTTLALLSLYLFSTGNVARLLITPLEHYPAINLQQLPTPKPKAIVILGAGTRAAPEYQGLTTDTKGLARLSYAAMLYRKTRLPILIAGGNDSAYEMKQVLSKRYNIKTKWTDEKSKDTFQNAKNAHELLSAAKIKRVYLVTSAWHMPRAMWSFKQMGLEPIAAPTDMQLMDEHDYLMGMLPSARALYLSSLALHEYIGLVWYRVIH